ncbi:hypothetical protein JDV02_001781 [Purpureocillium takamizusanense]|uniref:VPS37 C-terminal domain-containing protein n=1 Tax=Purpureocillium takamizusanense TaxID=2060973 RepID=A0A9Q8V7X9_9HYPO|nr:uncharacterized protein JDV02_001781 [Purpureocillium takamizusanense]UNI15227.1 hypothetical protein JDV02_001781 [Purpureocillium takamizusanense]
MDGCRACCRTSREKTPFLPVFSLSLVFPLTPHCLQTSPLFPLTVVLMVVVAVVPHHRWNVHSTQDLAALLASPPLLSALTHAPHTAHPTLAASHADLALALAQNARLAAHLRRMAARLARQRSATQAQLLATHALERQWRQRQSDMDHALAPFSPAGLYQRLAQGLQEQGNVCLAMEESFLEGGGGGGGGDHIAADAGTTTTTAGIAGARGADAAAGGGQASEREVADWVRRYREAKVEYYLRQERKERWDEGRVGGWR